MTITLQCSCGKTLQVQDQFAGRKGKCPSCGQTLDIPRNDDPEEDVPTPYRMAATDVPPEEDEPEAPPPPPPPSKPKRSRPRSEEGSWTPPEDVKDHAGVAIPPSADFFCDPPEEIGEVLSAFTTMKKTDQPTSLAVRLVIAFFAGAVGLVLGILIAINITTPFWQVFWTVGLTGLGLGITLLMTGFSHTCTYVGREGVAKFQCSGNRENIKSEMFRFADGAEVRTSQTRHYYNGAYTGTEYRYTWTDVAGRSRYTINGRYRAENGNPPHKDPYHYALAAEMAWTFYLLNQIQPQLQTSGSIFFGLGGRDWVRLAEQKMILFYKGETVECEADEIAHVSIEQGMFEVRRKDAKKGWFSSTGIFKFPYGNLANAQLFLFLLDKLVGVRVK